MKDNDIGVNLIIRDGVSGEILYSITYLFREGRIHSSFGDLSEIKNPEWTTKILNILGNVKNLLEQQINQLGLSLKAIKINIDESGLYG